MSRVSRRKQDGPRAHAAIVAGGQPVHYKASVAAARAPVHVGGEALSNGNEETVKRLAQFFPSATPVRLPVRVTALGGHSEQATLEYATGCEVLFASSLPLEFGERLRLHNADGSLDIEVFIVGLQFQAGRTAVAARFAQPVSNWIVKS